MSDKEIKSRVRDGLYLSNHGYLGALQRLIAHIEDGHRLISLDSDSLGDKFTTCSWGLCSESKEIWPDPDMHMWPGDFVKHGRIAPLYRRSRHSCPFDARGDMIQSMNGCFYACGIFQPKRMITLLHDAGMAVFGDHTAIRSNMKLIALNLYKRKLAYAQWLVENKIGERPRDNAAEMSEDWMVECWEKAKKESIELNKKGENHG